MLRDKKMLLHKLKFLIIKYFNIYIFQFMTTKYKFSNDLSNNKNIKIFWLYN